MALQAWTGRTAGQIDADSPVDVPLVGGFDDDAIHLRQVLYGNGSGGFLTPIDGHRHNGSDSQRLDVFINAAAGDYRVAGGDMTEFDTTSTSYVDTGFEIKIGRAGTYRVVFRLKSSGGLNAFGKIYKDDSPYGSEQDKAGAYEDKSEDLVFAEGDTLQLYLKSENVISTASSNYLDVRVLAPMEAGHLVV